MHITIIITTVATLILVGAILVQLKSAGVFDKDSLARRGVMDDFGVPFNQPEGYTSINDYLERNVGKEIRVIGRANNGAGPTLWLNKFPQTEIANISILGIGSAWPKEYARKDLILTGILQKEESGTTQVWVITNPKFEIHIPSEDQSVSQQENSSSDRQKAISIAEKKVLEEFPDFMRSGHKLELIRTVPVAGTKSLWFIKYDVSEGLDMSVEMKVDVDTREISDYQDSWA